ncbi:MAG: hypothetical protein AAF849_07180 [Bacteroidota bacterium]
MRRNKIYLFCLLTTVFICINLLFIQCTFDHKTNIKTYYFPLHNLKDGLVYEYRGVNNEQLPPYYWFYRSIRAAESTFLTGMYYDYTFTPQQFIREERIDNGMLLEETFIYETDSLGLQNQIPVEVAAGNAFPFEVKDSLGVFLYNISWYSPKDSMAYTLIRNRRYKGKTTFAYKDKDYRAIEFSVRELIETEQEGFLNIELEGKEIYAQGLGLVYVSKKSLDSNFEQSYQLYDTYSMEALEAKFGEQLEREKRKE